MAPPPPATPRAVREGRRDGPDDAWAAGVYAESGADEPAGLPVLVQHWDGEKWSKVERDAAPEGWLSFVGDLDAFGPENVWLTDFQWNPSTNEQTYALERWDGADWQRITLPEAPNDGEVQPWDITGTGPDDVWVTADAVKGAATTLRSITGTARTGPYARSRSPPSTRAAGSPTTRWPPPPARSTSSASPTTRRCPTRRWPSAGTATTGRRCPAASPWTR
ncbi:hypothetical protein NKH77_25240 [Streptomyces sp. M19]